VIGDDMAKISEDVKKVGKEAEELVEAVTKEGFELVEAVEELAENVVQTVRNLTFESIAAMVGEERAKEMLGL
jgi:hypothetical protein